VNKKDIVLLTLSASGDNYHSSVQIQKLLFLIGKRVPKIISSPYFDFEPYAYGPFDKEVYEVLEQLNDDGDVEIFYDPVSRLTRYRVMSQGYAKGKEKLETLDSDTQSYLDRLSQCVRKLSFTELISAIYREFPEMKVNSIFKG